MVFAVIAMMGLLGMGTAWWFMPKVWRRTAALSIRLGQNPLSSTNQSGIVAVASSTHRRVTAALGLILGFCCGLAFSFGVQAVAALGLALVLVALAWVDWHTHLLPDFLTLPLLGAGLVLNAFDVFVTWPQAIAGAVLGYGFLWAAEALYRRWSGRHGLGGGDFKCLAALGAWLGWQTLPSVLFLATSLSVIGWGVAALMYRRPPARQQPLGPGLAISGLVLLFITLGSVAP
ncbi:MAG: A24 family peptidase [Castellaniella sp.]